MRTPFVFMAGLLATVACGPTPNVVYVPAPAPVLEPAPVVAELPPVGITIARVDDARMLVSTNQPAYVAVFEIIPDRGVSLVYPTMRTQRQLMTNGSSWVTLARSPLRDDGRYARDERYDRNDRHDRYDRVSRPPTVRYLYAIASDRPLRLSDAAFNDDDYLRDVLGDRAYRSTDPYRTMELLSRRMVPAGREAEWGEDLVTMDVGRPAPVMRVAKVYCPDGNVIYVHDEMADRVVCAARGHGRGQGDGNRPAPRPDSVVASSGQPVPWHKASKVAPPVFRIPTRTDMGEAVLQQGGPDAGNRGHGGGNGTGTGGGVARGDSASADGHSNGHQDNGNHYGQNGNNGNGQNGNNGNNGNAYGQNGNGSGNNGNGHGNASNGNANNGSNGSNGNNGNNGRRPVVSDTATHGTQGAAPAARPVRPWLPATAQPAQPAPAVPAVATPAPAATTTPAPVAKPAPAREPKADTAAHAPVKRFMREARPDAQADTARVKP